MKDFDWESAQIIEDTQDSSSVQAKGFAPRIVQPMQPQQNDDFDWASAQIVEQPPTPKGVGGFVKDMGLMFGSGAARVGGSAIAAVDSLATGGKVSKAIDDAGLNYGDQLSDYFQSKLSDEYKAQQAGFQQAGADKDTFLGKVADKTAYALRNPSTILGTVAQSGPDMIAGGIVGGKLAKKSKGKINAEAGAAIGEGFMMAGHQAEDIRQETDDKLLTPEQRGYVLATGVAGSLFGWAGNRIARQLGLADVDTLIAQRSIAPEAIAQSIASMPAKSLPKAIVQGAISEGLLEELPQEVSGQILQNLALDKDWHENLDESVVMGTLAGMAMGGPVAGVSAYSANRQQALQDASAEQDHGTGINPDAPIDTPPTGNAFEHTPPPQVQDDFRTESFGFQKPSERMGLNPNDGPMSSAAALAVDSIPQLGRAPLEGELVGGEVVPFSGRNVDPSNYTIDAWGNVVDIDGNPVQQDPSRFSQLENMPTDERPKPSMFEVDEQGNVRSTLNQAEYDRQQKERNQKERIDLSSLGPKETKAAIDIERNDSAESIWNGLNSFQRSKYASEILGERGILAKKAAASSWDKLNDKQRAKLEKDLSEAVGTRWNDPNKVVSSDDKPVLQNRDRSNPTMIEQMLKIQNEPDYSLVSYSRDFGNGAPVVEQGVQVSNEQLGREDTVTTAKGRKVPVQYAVVEADQLVASNRVDGTSIAEYANPVEGKSRAIAGNGRIAGLQGAWANGKAAEYKNDMASDDLHGIDAEVIERMKKPILVRIMPNDMVTNDIGDESNISTNSDKTVIETARDDSQRIDLSKLEFSEGGEVSPDTVMSFVRELPLNERNALVSGGAPSQQGQGRFMNALFQQAYESDALTEVQASTTNTAAKNILNGMAEAAPSMVKLRGAGEYDVRGAVAEAVGHIINMQNRGFKIADTPKQVDAGFSDDAFEILKYLSSTRSGKKIGETLKRIADESLRIAETSGSDMFGEIVKPAPSQIIDAVLRGNSLSYDGQNWNEAPFGADATAQAKPAQQRDPSEKQQAEVQPSEVSHEKTAETNLEEDNLENETALPEVAPEAGAQPEQPIQEPTTQASTEQQVQPTETERQAAPSFEIEKSKDGTGIRVYGDPKEIRELTTKAGIIPKGSEIDGGLSFGAKLEDRIRQALNVSELEQEVMTELADDVPSDVAETAEVDPNSFVTAPDGSINFGEITPEIAKDMRRQAGKIRLTSGVQNSDGTGYGLVHIEANHGKQIRNAGYESVEDFVFQIAKNFNQINRADGGQLLLAVKKDGNKQDVLFVRLEPLSDGEHYQVNTAFPASRNYLEKQEGKGSEKLWSRSEPILTDAENQPLYAGNPENNLGQDTPIAQGQSSNDSLAQKPTKEQGDSWKDNYIVAAKKARELGIDPRLYRKLDELIEVIERTQKGEIIEERPLPEIIIATKKEYIKKLADEKGLKPKSAGYKTQIEKVERQYERELDEAYANLSFSEFNRLNSESPESLNRMSWESLREEYNLPIDEAAKELEQEIEAAASEVDTQPSEAQKEAGNYKKGHVSIQGLDIAIENPKGSERSGTDKDGKKWSVKMDNHYGYIKSTEGADGDQVDVFIGDSPDSNAVFIVDQINQEDGSFDEHKVMLGFTNQLQAKNAYRKNYDKGWKVGEVKQLTMDEFKQWLKEGNTTKPAEEFNLEQEKAFSDNKEQPIHERIDAIHKHLNGGNPLTVNDVRAVFDDLVGNQIAAKNALSKLTKKQLTQYVNGYTSSDTKKDELVRRAFNGLINNFRFIGNDKGVISTSHGQDIVELAREHIDSLTDEQLANYAKERKALIDERMGEIRAERERLDNPETLEDYQKAIKERGMGALSDEQKAIYDRLVAERSIQKEEKPALIEGLKTDEALEVGEVTEGKNTKTGETIYNVKVIDRLGKDKFKEALAFSRKLKGGYWKGDFYFPSTETAEQFRAWLSGSTIDLTEQQAQQEQDKQEKAVGKLKAMAERIEAQANETINADRKTNTNRRADMAANIIGRAEKDAVHAQILSKIANGEAPLLVRLTDKTQVQLLDNLVSGLRYTADKSLINTDANSNYSFKPEVTPEQMVRTAAYPLSPINIHMAENLAQDMGEVGGYKLAAANLRKNVSLAKRSNQNGFTLDPKVLDKIYEYVAKHGKSHLTYTSNVQNRKRLERMGISNLPALRAALVEFIELKQSVSKPKTATKLQTMEQELERKVRNNRNAFNDFFPTPDTVANEVVELADIQDGMRVLEPSAGNGQIADAIRSTGATVEVAELSYELSEILREKGYKVIASDFMEDSIEGGYDRIVMNPPFSKDQDIDHVMRAYELLEPNGRLVAIVSSMAGDRANNKNKSFRQLLDEVGAEEQALPEGAFKSSMNPTGANTKVVVIDKPDNESTIMHSSRQGKDPEAKTAERIQKAVSGKSIHEVADYIIANAENKAQEAIARKVAEKLKQLEQAGVKFNFEVTHLGSQAPQELNYSRGFTEFIVDDKGNINTSVFISGTDMVGRVGMDNETILHELIHAATGITTQLGRINPNSEHAKHLKDLGELQDTVIEHLIARRKEIGQENLNQFEKDILEQRNNATLNEDEILAWGLTNPEMQQYMESIPYKSNETIWGKFVSLIRGLLGLPASEQTALSELLRVAEHILEADPFTTKGTKNVSKHGNPLYSTQQTADRWGMSRMEMSKAEAAAAKVHDFAEKAAAKADGWTNKDRVVPSNWSDAQKQAASKFDTFTPRQPFASRLRQIKDVSAKRFMQLVFDQFNPLRDLSQKAFMQAHLSRGAEGSVEAIATRGVPYLRDGAISVSEDGNGFMGKLAKLGDMEEVQKFLMWVSAQRAEQLMAEGRENLFTPEDIAAMKEFASGKLKDGRIRRIEYANTLKELNKYNKAVLDIAEQAGLVNAEARASWESEFYIPFYRVMQDEDGKVSGQFSHSDSGLMRQEVIKRLKGGKENLGDPLENLLSNWSNLIAASMKNMAANEALIQGVELGISEPSEQKFGNQLWTMQDGQRVYWDVHDKHVLEALEALNFNGYQNDLMKAAGKFKRMLTMGVTVSPTFRIRSLIRDTLHGIAVSDIGYNPLANMMNGWKLADENSETLTQMMAGGGAIRFGAMEDGQSKDYMRRMIRQGSITDAQILDTPTKFRNAMSDFFSGYQKLGDKMESVNRAVIYERVLKKTGSHLEASFASRDVMNYTSMGSAAVIRAMAQVLPFFNARLQGLNKLVRGANEDPRRFWGVTSTIGMASALLYLLQSGDDEYDELPDYVRDTYWPIKMGDKWVYIPKPFEVGVMATVIERGTELMLAGEDYQAKDFANTLTSLLINNLSLNPVPQILLPAGEVWLNYDSFRGGNIDSMAMQRLLPEDRYDANTSAGAVGLGKLLGVSPKKIEHLVVGYFGWIGIQALNVSDLLGRSIVDMPASAKWDMSQSNNWLLAGDFLKEEGSTPSKYSKRFYEVQRDIGQRYATANAARREGDMERYREIMDDPAMRARPMLASANNRITKINQQIRKVVADRNLTAAEKTERLRVFYERRDAIAKDIDKRYRGG